MSKQSIFEIIGEGPEERKLSPIDINNILDRFEGAPVVEDYSDEADDDYEEEDIIAKFIRERQNSEDVDEDELYEDIDIDEEIVYDRDSPLQFGPAMTSSYPDDDDEDEEESGGWAYSISIDASEDELSRYVSVESGEHQSITFEMSDLVADRNETEQDMDTIKRYIYTRLVNIVGDLEPCYVLTKSDFDELIVSVIKTYPRARFIPIMNGDVVLIYYISVNDYRDMYDAARMLNKEKKLKSFFDAFDEVAKCSGMSFRSRDWDVEKIKYHPIHLKELKDLISNKDEGFELIKEGENPAKIISYSIEYQTDTEPESKEEKEEEMPEKPATMKIEVEDEAEVEEVAPEEVLLEDIDAEIVPEEVPEEVLERAKEPVEEEPAEETKEDEFDSLFEDIEEDGEVTLTEEEEYLADPDAAEIEEFGRVVSDDFSNVKRWP